jgi:transposase
MKNLGIDIHKRSGLAVLKDEEGNIMESLRFSNDRRGISRLIRMLEPHGDVRAAVEASGNFWIRLYEALEESGVEVLLSNPMKTRAIAEARIKSDKLDASILADLVRADLVAESYVPPREVRDRRALLRYRVGLIRSRVKVKNRVHALLDRHEADHGFTDLFGAGGMKWLEDIELPGMDGLILRLALSEIRHLNGLLEEVSRAIAREAVKDKRVELLLGFKGIDYYTAMVLVNEIGDINRFSSAKKLVSWAGLCPSLHQSGPTLRTGGITKRGNKWVRWVMTQAAHQAARFDPKMRGFFLRVERRRGRQKAIVAVARKLLVSVYYVLSRMEPYHGEAVELKRRKVIRLRNLASDRSSRRRRS